MQISLQPVWDPCVLQAPGYLEQTLLVARILDWPYMGATCSVDWPEQVPCAVQVPQMTMQMLDLAWEWDMGPQVWPCTIHPACRWALHDSCGPQGQMTFIPLP